MHLCKSEQPLNLFCGLSHSKRNTSLQSAISFINNITLYSATQVVVVVIVVVVVVVVVRWLT